MRIELIYNDRLSRGGDVASRSENAVSLPGKTWVVPLDDDDAFRIPLQKIEGSLVFVRT